MVSPIEYLQPFGICISATNEQRKISDWDIATLKRLLRENQLLVLSGFDEFSNVEDLSDYCDRWGEVSLWPFGKVLELIAEDEPQDHIFDNSYVPLHWDGMYRPHVPEYQIFQCVKAPMPGQGGRTLFVNTSKLLADLPEKTRRKWQKISGHYQRRMSFYDSKTSSPLLTKHPYLERSVIRYNEPHDLRKGGLINPVQASFSGLAAQQLQDCITELNERLYDPAYCYAHDWLDGDIVIADNFSLLHGREAFVDASARHIRRVQIEASPLYKNPGLEFYQ
jgi:alpha-ketoglutarate-dependent taurine dioxygenase